MSSNNDQPGIAQGIWVFVVGPSGAGKDTVINLARRTFKDNKAVQFARRVVTRPHNEFEDHDTLTAKEFEACRQRGEFILWWHAHQLSYGIDQQWQNRVNDGAVVVCNISRAILPEVRERISGGCKIVLVTASPDILAARIAARGRDAAKGSRTGRDLDGAVRQMADVIIDNMGRPEDAGEQLATFLRSLSKKVPV